MPETAVTHLRVLIANEKRDRLELLAPVVAGLRHHVIAREIYGAAINAVEIVAGVHSSIKSPGVNVSASCEATRRE